MSSSDAIKKVAGLKAWKRDGQRAPHKPLLMLVAIAEFEKSGAKSVSYKTVKERLGALLLEFGPNASKQGTQYPFVRLANDGLWVLEGVGVAEKGSSGDISSGKLLGARASGHFPEWLYESLSKPSQRNEIVNHLLYSNFPETIHTDILDSLGIEREALQLEPSSKKHKRDPQFRNAVLSAYDNQCAFCGYGGALDRSPAGIEAAHIRWHAFEGPDTTENSLALCSLHHKLFDLGVWTLEKNFEIAISAQLHGNNLEAYLLDFNGKKIYPPHSERHLPKEEYLTWHREQVFKTPSRGALNTNERIA